jgi:tRNA nucleotidyltransferase (CCA-adding enzyme)
LAARFAGALGRIDELSAAAILDLLQAADALRRPERLDALLEAGAALAPGEFAAAKRWRDAQDVVRRVALGDVARAHVRADAISKAVRAARLAALRAWKRRPDGTG